MAVEIRNESPFPLTFADAAMEHGQWTDPWQPHSVAPGAVGEFRAEGGLVGVATTGTEGRVRFNVDGDAGRQLYVHFNSPLIESQYGNTFHVWAPPRFEAATDGGQGHDARLVIRFRPTAKRRVPGFMPSVCAFAFSNSWNPDLPAMTVGFLWNRLLDQLPDPLPQALGIARVDDNWLPITHASAGLCGGMVFSTMDYCNARQLAPRTNVAPSSTADPLFQHIRLRLLDSFDIGGSGHRWLGYSSPHYPNGDEGVFQVVGLTRGRSWVTYRDEWPRIRNDIEAGRLSPVGLVQTDALALGDNHQVLAYAYEQDGQRVRLWINDPNEPGGDDVRLEFDITDTAGEVHVDRVGGRPGNSKRIFCIMRLDGYEAKHAPGGRPGDSATLRQALLRRNERRNGRLPVDTGIGRPSALRAWMRSL